MYVDSQLSSGPKLSQECPPEVELEKTESRVAALKTSTKNLEKFRISTDSLSSRAHEKRNLCSLTFFAYNMAEWASLQDLPLLVISSFL